MTHPIAIRREFLVQADKLVKERANPLNIVATTSALEAVINTMTNEPMRLLVVTAVEAKAIEEFTGIST